MRSRPPARTTTTVVTMRTRKRHPALHPTPPAVTIRTRKRHPAQHRNRDGKTSESQEKSWLQASADKGKKHRKEARTHHSPSAGGEGERRRQRSASRGVRGQGAAGRSGRHANHVDCLSLSKGERVRSEAQDSEPKPVRQVQGSASRNKQSCRPATRSAIQQKSHRKANVKAAEEVPRRSSKRNVTLPVSTPSLTVRVNVYTAPGTKKLSMPS